MYQFTLIICLIILRDPRDFYIAVVVCDGRVGLEKDGGEGWRGTAGLDNYSDISSG